MCGGSRQLLPPGRHLGLGDSRVGQKVKMIGPEERAAMQCHVSAALRVGVCMCLHVAGSLAAPSASQPQLLAFFSGRCLQL